MVDPLSWDIAGFLLPLAIAAALFFVGMNLRRVPRALRYAVIALAVMVVGAAGLGLANLLPFSVWAVVSYLGGSTMLLSWAAIFLAAVVWRVPGRSFSTAFLIFLVGISGVLIVLEAGGRLYWRFFAPEVWQKFPNREGLVQQSSGMTCSPTAAAMLLFRYDVKSSEGEMAYLAYTSVFGTDAFAMARAISRLVERHGLQARAVKTDFDTRLEAKRPFIAHVRTQFGGHALLIEMMRPQFLIICDPATGERHSMSRVKFESIWDGTAIEIVPQTGA